MLIYLEKKAKPYPLTQRILQQFPQSDIIEIQHYKNLFDKTLGSYPLEPCILLAVQEPVALLDTPPHYGFPGPSFFFKPSVNCLFDCSYCYLKGTFKNRFPVIFVNDEAMQHTLDQKIRELRQTGYKGQITFYASNYADLLAIDHWTHFHETFLPFFEQYDNVLLESRTKSVNISGLKQLALQREQPFQNTEIAFSLSPEIITTTYEKKTAPLAHKLAAIQELLTLGYRVGLRFLPLLPLEGYQQLYRALIQQVQASIDINAIASLFIAPLLYHKEDFKRLKKQYATTPLQQDFPFLDFLQEREQGLMKMEEAYYRDFEQLFSSAFPTHHIQRDYQ